MRRGAGVVLSLLAALCLTACAPRTLPTSHPIGGRTVEPPALSQSDAVEEALARAGEIPHGDAIPGDAIPISGGAVIAERGDYVLRGESFGKILVRAEGVRLFLENAALRAEEKALECETSLTITLVGENFLASSAASRKSAIDCAGDLLCNGGGTLRVEAAKHAIAANSVRVAEATLVLTAEEDGIRVEGGAEGGFFVLDGGRLSIDSKGDGIRADAFVLLDGDVRIVANGGAPAEITEASSDRAAGKGIRADAANAVIALLGGKSEVDANDDALHSEGEIALCAGTAALSSGDDAVHAEGLLTVSGGELSVLRSYEGLEGERVEVRGGTISIRAENDGINAADETGSRPGFDHPNCHIIVAGGTVTVDAEGDGLDSNGRIYLLGGTLIIAGPSKPDNTALDSDGGLLIDGGTIIAADAGAAELPAENSAQRVVLVYGDFAAQKRLSLVDAAGNPILSVTLSKPGRAILFSCPAFEAGQQVVLTADGTQLGKAVLSGTVTLFGSVRGRESLDRSP